MMNQDEKQREKVEMFSFAMVFFFAAAIVNQQQKQLYQ